jgi:hypothetical protein
LDAANQRTSHAGVQSDKDEKSMGCADFLFFYTGLISGR